MNKRGEENRSVRRTRERLHGAMVELLRNHAVADITVRALTELADVNRSTFYLHYRDVYDLLEQMERGAIEEMQVFLTSEKLAVVHRDPYVVIRELFVYLYENRERFVVLFGPNGRKEAKQQAMDYSVMYLARLLQQEGLAEERNLNLGIRFILEGGVGVLEKYYFEEDPAEMEELVRFFAFITEVISRGYLQKA